MHTGTRWKNMFSSEKISTEYPYAVLMSPSIDTRRKNHRIFIPRYTVDIFKKPRTSMDTRFLETWYRYGYSALSIHTRSVSIYPGLWV